MAREVNQNTQKATPGLGQASKPAPNNSGTQPGPKGTPPQPRGGKGVLP